MIKIKRQISFTWAALAGVALMALIAASGLFVLRKWHDHAAHGAAAHTVAEKGQWLTMNLASRAMASLKIQQAGMDGWRDFSGLLASLHDVEPDLELISIRRGDVTVFQEVPAKDHLPSLLTDEYGFQGPVTMGRRILAVDTGRVQVVTFSVVLTNQWDEPVVIELGLNRDAVEREEWTSIRAIDSMYRFSLATVCICFAICLGLVAWMAHREERRTRARRREEHLAFSGVLANGIVHDFRNPMSSLRLDVQMLEKEATQPDGVRVERLAQLATRIRRTLDRMEQVFQEFLTLARPDEERKEALDLAACARDCALMLMPRFEAAHVQLDIRVEEQVDFTIRATPASIKRAILNVLVNALQHAGSPGCVQMELRRLKERIYLDICDNGKGIAPQEREKIFGMFHTTRPQGTGLGLFLSRTAVENNGGRLTAVERPEGEGACLRMDFAAEE